MKRMFWIFALWALLAPSAAGQTAESEIESITGVQWQQKGISYFVPEAGGSSEMVVLGDSLWWADVAGTHYVRCPTEPAAFSLDSLQSAALETLNGNAETGTNGPVLRMAECIDTFSSVFDSLR